MHLVHVQRCLAPTPCPIRCRSRVVRVARWAPVLVEEKGAYLRTPSLRSSEAAGTENNAFAVRTETSAGLMRTRNADHGALSSVINWRGPGFVVHRWMCALVHPAPLVSNLHQQGPPFVAFDFQVVTARTEGSLGKRGRLFSLP